MSKLYFILTFALCLAIPSWCMAASPKDCADDPRAGDLTALLMETGNGEQISGPVSVSPDTFIHLQPDTRRKLAGHLLICGYPLTKKGIPAVKMEMDFPDIWDAIEIAVALDDWDTVALIRDSVKPRKLQLEALYSLYVKPVFGEKIMKHMAKELGIVPRWRDWDFYLLDVFNALGGYAEKPEKVFFVSNDDIPKEKAALETRKIPLAVWREMLDKDRRSIERAGIRVVHSPWDLYHNCW